MYEPRTYRNWVKDDDLVGFEAIIKETDLFIRAQRNLYNEAIDSIKTYRSQIEEYIAKDPEFQTTLKPYKVNGNSPSIIQEMSQACALVGVGPFAAVAGAIAEYVGKDLLRYSEDIIIENGGDIFIKSSKNRLVGVYAGSSSFSGKVAVEIEAKDTPLGICTSAGTVGHSLSFGKADAVVVLSKSTFLADAAATAIGNIIQTKDDIPKGIKFAQKVNHALRDASSVRTKGGVNGLSGVLIIKDDKMGLWGKVKIARM